MMGKGTNSYTRNKSNHVISMVSLAASESELDDDEFEQQNIQYIGGDNNNTLPNDQSDGATQVEEEVVVFMESQTRYVSCMRTAVLFVLVVVTGIVSFVAFSTTRRTEQQLFLELYESDATFLMTKISSKITQKLRAVDSMSISISGSTKAKEMKQHNTTTTIWPYVTLQDYDWQSASVNSLAEAVSLYLVPIVPAEQRLEWEDYTQQHLDWVDEGLQFEATRRRSSSSRRSLQTSSTTSTTSTVSVSSSVSPHIFTVDQGKTVPMTQPNLGDDSYFPLWQSSPVLSDLTNYDLNSSPEFKGGLDAVLTSQKAVIGKAVTIKSNSDSMIFQVFQAHWQETAGVYGDDPISKLYVPIWNYRPHPRARAIHQGNSNKNNVTTTQQQQQDESSSSSSSPRIVAILISVIFWETYFSDILENESTPLIVVVKNECDQTYSYEISGPQVNYMGDSDQHDPKFNEYVFLDQQDQQSSSSSEGSHNDGQNDVNNVSDDVNDKFQNGGIVLDKEYCPYSFYVYPTKEYYNHFHSNKPYLLMGTVIIIFGCAVIMFEVYVYMIEKRQTKVMSAAQKTDHIVSELFPQQVRERMYLEQEGEQQEKQQQQDADTTEDDVTLTTSMGESKQEQALLDAAPLKRLSFAMQSSIHAKRRGSITNGISSALDVVQQPSQRLLVSSKAAVDADIEGAAKLGKPIADKYAETTVLFIEVVGFSAWSSQREPTEVFVLLETLFQSFDTVAKKLNVFKVETIGETYMAVTGLPLAQPDHAVRMARFARECMHRVRELTRSLEVELGPDTGDLQLKIGLNSGPVTAGVLKGEKSRFQLFGDTVNTAARMESLGMASRIQCSASTATLLKEAGKEKWVMEREELVKAKGKGEIQTYWISPRATSSGEVGDGYPEGDGGENNHSGLISSNMVSIQLHEKQRMIDWQVELLLSHLRRIKARREELALQIKRPLQEEEVDFHQTTGSSAMDEVTEIIKVPVAQDTLGRLKSGRNLFKQSDTIRQEKIRSIPPEMMELDMEVVDQLRDYVTTIASMYQDNAFHCFEHATHVTMSAYKLLKRVRNPADSPDDSSKEVDLDEYAYGMTSNPLTQFALLFCALIHDVDHAGVSNFQLVKEDSPLAKLYQHRSVAEQNSIDISWDLLMDPNYADLRKAIYRNKAELAHFRQLVVNIVLATDIFDKHMKDIREKRWDKAFLYDHQYQHEEGEWGTPSGERPAPVLKGRDDKHLKATIVMEHLVQASDVAHTMQHWDIYLKWNERLYKEMKLAFEMGRALKDPATVWYEGEIIFFDKYIIPLAKKLAECGVFGVSSDECLNYALSNRTLWAVRGDDIVQQFQKSYEADKSSIRRRSVTCI